jgi:2,4-dienoyl-CoA reductase-like NADH-dependent reductase (Old Yellow Enzyme family)
MATESATESGEPTQKTLEHYHARARAGVGLIVLEHAYVSTSGRFSRHQLGIHSDGLVPLYRDIVGELHSAGATVALQITHCGSAGTRDLTGSTPLGASAALHPNGTQMPRELPAAEIAELKEAFLEAALRVDRAGFDMVMVHSAHGYLLSQFLSPLTNKREDIYGGPVASRAALLVAIVQAIKGRAPGLPVIVRLGIQDQYPDSVPPNPIFSGGLTLEDGIEAARLTESAGADLLDISGGMCGSRPSGAPAAYFLPWVERLKPAVNIPVVTTGGIAQAQMADDIVRQGKADMVGVGRAMLKDADWAASAIRTLKNTG